MYRRINLIEDTQIGLRILARNLRRAEERGDTDLYESLLREPMEIVVVSAGDLYSMEAYLGIHVIEMSPHSMLEETEIKRMLRLAPSGPWYRQLEYPHTSRRSSLMRTGSLKSEKKK